MVKRMYKKGLVVGIIILFVSMGVLTSASSKDLSISDEKIVEDNNENEPLDMNIEIFTYIHGWCDSATGKRTGESIYLDVELWSAGRILTIIGIGFPFIVFIKEVTEVNIPCFIGEINKERTPHYVNGIAFGNIEQS